MYPRQGGTDIKWNSPITILMIELMEAGWSRDPLKMRNFFPHSHRMKWVIKIHFLKEKISSIPLGNWSSVASSSPVFSVVTAAILFSSRTSPTRCYITELYNFLEQSYYSSDLIQSGVTTQIYINEIFTYFIIFFTIHIYYFIHLCIQRYSFDHSISCHSRYSQLYWII